MLGVLPRRLVESVVGLFALLGFFYVPLGKLTGFEHLKAIARTEAATRASQEIVEAVWRMRSKLFATFAGDERKQTDPQNKAPEAEDPVRAPRGAKPRVPRLRPDDAPANLHAAPTPAPTTLPAAPAPAP